MHIYYLYAVCMYVFSTYVYEYLKNELSYQHFQFREFLTQMVEQALTCNYSDTIVFQFATTTKTISSISRS